MNIYIYIYIYISNFGQAPCRLPDDGLHGPKHVVVTVKNVLM